MPKRFNIYSAKTASTRGIPLLLLVLALTSEAENVSAQPAALQVQVYDYTGLNSSALSEFLARTQRILTVAGVSVEVAACPPGRRTPCEGRQGSFKQVVLRVVAQAPANQKNGRWRHLGQSIANQEGGPYATLYLNLAEEEAAETNLSTALVLSYAAAHEVGHLLLGTQAHTPESLMKARWVSEDFQAMAQNLLRFSAQQCWELHRRFGAGQRTEISGDAEIAAGH
jgi:hypothetical protein